MTQEDFIEGIVSQRQYTRYRSGQCEMTYEKLSLFAERLGIPTKKLLTEFEKTKTLQNQTLNIFYNAVVNRDTVRIKETRAEIEKFPILDEDRKLYLDHAQVLDEFLSGKIKKEHILSVTEKQINYPAILKQNFLSDTEVLILSYLLTIADPENQKIILRKLSLLYENDEAILSGDKDFVHPLILMRISKIYGMQNNFDRVIQFCDLGIRHGTDNKQYYLLDYFYYYKSLAYFKLETYDLFEDALFKCYNTLQLEGNKKKIEKFTALIEKDFHINFDGFIINYLKKRIM